LKSLPLHDIGDGRYEAIGQLTWLKGGDTWLTLVPRINEFTMNDKDFSGDPTMDIGPISDTLSWQNNELTQKLTWVLIAFSIIAFAPLVESLREKNTK